MAPTQPTIIETISKLLSKIFNPINSLIFYFILFSFEKCTWQESVLNFIPLFLLIILPVTLWIYWNVKQKRYSDSDVSNRQQRKEFYFFIAASIIAYLTFIYIRYDRIDWVVSFLFILLVTMQISNYFIKSSMHTSLNIFVAAMMLILNPLYGLIWLFISISVGISRVILKRHTPSEVVSGAIIGSIVSFIYIYSQIQIMHN